jgi:hypothetical protein
MRIVSVDTYVYCCGCLEPGSLNFYTNKANHLNSICTERNWHFMPNTIFLWILQFYEKLYKSEGNTLQFYLILLWLMLLVTQYISWVMIVQHHFTAALLVGNWTCPYMCYLGLLSISSDEYLDSVRIKNFMKKWTSRELSTLTLKGRHLSGRIVIRVECNTGKL